ncbi:phenylalanine--tRNA ligase subunit alpha [Deferribacterales bacterium RsTz2092]|nr:phenylalanine--tRNA ligase alpha subunit [Deferribacterales bacterium]
MDNTALINDFTGEIHSCTDLAGLYNIKVKYLGKKGVITDLNKQLSAIPADERPAAGAEINKLRLAFEELFNTKQTELKSAERNAKLANECIDVTMPAAPAPLGHLHPVYQIYDEIVDIFGAMGFSVATGPEAELDLYNFTMLNMPKGHPARDMQDTFYISEDVVLRTHTSPVQVRTMLNKKPPVRIIAPGKVYRSDHDSTHSPMFHQVEGLLVDKNISLSDLKGTLQLFVHLMFGDDIPTRFRSSYFPFTEPSMEVDMGCVICKGAGCRVCKSSGWLEIGGSGMVAPEVLAAVGIDSLVYSGFAFGMGMERIAMLKYGIDDLRLFFENRLEFIEQF